MATTSRPAADRQDQQGQRVGAARHGQTATARRQGRAWSAGQRGSEADRAQERRPATPSRPPGAVAAARLVSRPGRPSLRHQPRDRRPEPAPAPVPASRRRPGRSSRPELRISDQLGSHSGPSHTLASRSGPPAASTASMKRSPCSYWRSLASRPIRTLTHLGQAALAPSLLEDLAEPGGAAGPGRLRPGPW